MYLEHEFEHVINHDGHPIAVIEGKAIFHVWGLIEFDWKISELWLRDTDSRDLFTLDLDSDLSIVRADPGTSWRWAIFTAVEPSKNCRDVFSRIRASRFGARPFLRDPLHQAATSHVLSVWSTAEAEGKSEFHSAHWRAPW